ncbi:MAG: response regulator [Candidatus Poribacteria bacterium]|nr:response regulator [Candidatus Poribacteria bacterium]
MAKSEKKPENEKILVVCEVKDDLEQINHYLRSRDFDYQSTIDRNVGVGLFVSLKPAILLLRFPDINEAVTYHTRLSKQPTLTQAIVLVNLPDTEKALDLIKQQMISDYSVFKPIYDTHHLNGCIMKAFIRVTEQVQMNQLQQQVDQYKKGLTQYKARLRKAMQRSQEGLGQFLRDKLDTFRNQMGQAEFAEIAKVINKQKLNEKFSGLKADVVETGVKAFAQKINDDLEGDGAQPDQQGTILLVEPNTREMRRISTTLEHQGFSMLQAEDDVQTINHLRKDTQEINLILMSLELPKANGMLFAARLKKDRRTKSIPIIIMAKTLSRRLIVASEKTGLSGLLAKPVGDAEILAKIEAVLQQKY